MGSELVAPLLKFNLVKSISFKLEQDVALLEKATKKNVVQLLLLQSGIVKILGSNGFPVFSTQSKAGVFSFNLDILPTDSYTLLVSANHIML